MVSHMILDDDDGLDGSVHIKDASGRSIWLTFDDFEPIAEEFFTKLNGARQFAAQQLHPSGRARLTVVK
jgi:hypothetical protein